ncbi:MAG TPA: hypothetical protein VF747_00540 [Blastocatellia bacterium]
MKSEHHQTDALAARQADAEDPPAELISVDTQLTQLRSQISDLGFELDSQKSGIAASMGAGVFLLLLGVIAGYDLFKGNAGIWSPLGVTRDLLLFIACGLGAAGVALLIQGLIRQRRRDREPEARLAELEEEYSRLLDHREAISKDQ